MRIYSYGLAEMCEARIALRFRIDGGSLEYRGETIGISPRHLIASSPVELLEGHRLTLRMRIAIEDGGRAYSEIEMFGWVVCGSKLEEGKFGYQVEIERGD